MPTQPEWFVLQFKPNGQKIAQDNLKRQKYETFLPLQKITRRSAGKFKQLLQPLFPGYMFICFDPATAPWQKINSTRGVCKLVSFGDRPNAVPTEFVEYLRYRFDGDEYLFELDKLSVGDEVNLISGPFAELAATVEKIDSNKRLWVLLELMGQPTRISIDNNRVQSTSDEA